MPVNILPSTLSRKNRQTPSAGVALSAVGLTIAAVLSVTSANAYVARGEETPPAIEQVALVEQQATQDAVEQQAVQTIDQVPALQPAPVVLPEPPAPAYANNLDGWIREALDILGANSIPASYDGIMRNVMRESTGNPQAINLWDSNAAAGIPSKGLLQVIAPTFQAYHVTGTSEDIYDPVANIVAACNYAAHRYGSMDNVNSAY